MKRGIYALLITVMTGGALAGCGDKVKPGVHEVKREQVKGIISEVLKTSEVDEYFETTGTVRAKNISIIASRVMGTVTSIRVKEGDIVAAGQLLIEIDDRDVAQRVKAAERGLEGTKQHQYLSDITYQRYKKLYDEKAISGQELDRIETQKKMADIEYERAKAMLAEARIHQDFTRIASPVSGVITEKKIELGSMAVPGMSMLTVEDNSAFRVEVNADEKLSGRLRKGMAVSVFIESINKELAGKVAEIVPSMDPMTRSFLVKIALSDKDLKNGYYAKVTIPLGKKQSLLVPKKAVVEKGQLTGVYTVNKNSVIAYRLVRAGKSSGERVEIIAGLTPGDTVIVDGLENAVDGGILVDSRQTEDAR